ncbi:pyridoxal phosphate-dependent aminotransferase [Aspergillus tanneri]|uniref:histidinol-phosphate transaminase n=1 Tax=Aspergillus tanneri TaxID=1220188 RepID=A0A5M9MDY9_9EURO|nr:histidinol-phosphate transaminase [Aspergillus tanneri]KAA8645192.1 histidinol-phosphate transaminase [Aspergillus tanneri]
MFLRCQNANENSLGTCIAPPSKPNNTWDSSYTNELLAYAFAGTTALNRYPSALQAQLKNGIADTKREFGITSQNICLGTGAADIIDLIIRTTCRPGQDAILVPPPTFGLYQVRAALNDIDVVSSPLDASFNLQVTDVHGKLEENPNIKLIFLASPGNPTGTLISLQDIQAVLDFPGFHGYVVVDEAYIDYSNSPDKSTALNLLAEYQNIIVVQTFSKGPGLAGLRVGIAFSHPETANMLDKVQMPYTISTPTSILAQAAISSNGKQLQKRLVRDVIANRESLSQALADPNITELGVGKPLGSGEANFIVLPILNRESQTHDQARAELASQKLQEDHGISVRLIGMMTHCDGCLRITIGTKHDNDKFVEGIRKVLEVI